MEKEDAVILSKLQCPKCGSADIKIPMDLKHNTYVVCNQCKFENKCKLYVAVEHKVAFKDPDKK